MNSKELQAITTILQPIISDDNQSLSILQAVYGEIDLIFKEYQGKLLTRTGCIQDTFGLISYEVAAKRHLYAPFFIKLGCIREESQDLRGLLLRGFKANTTIWGMTPKSVVCLNLNMNARFNKDLSILLDVNLPPHFSLGVLADMIDNT